jgi:hypothetical protein
MNRFTEEDIRSTQRVIMDNTICEAALLLKTVTELAFKEINEYQEKIESSSTVSSTSSPELPTPLHCDEARYFESKCQDMPRLRTVSECSPFLNATKFSDFEPGPLHPPPLLLSCSNQQNIQPIFTTVKQSSNSSISKPSTLITNLNQNLPPIKHLILFPARKTLSEKKAKGNYVGMHTPHKLKGVLQHKFNWKKFPEVWILMI